nr:MAG TPA: DNA ligase [Caudoviricetes sp.]
MSYDGNLNVEATDNSGMASWSELKKALVKVVDISTPVNYRGNILPVVRIEPKLKAGNYEITHLHIKSWLDMKRANIYPGGTVYCRYGNGRCDFEKAEFSPRADKETDKFSKEICCPICKSRDYIVHSDTVKRCVNPDCGYNNIKAIWCFLRICLKFGSMPYMCVYNLWSDGALKKLKDIWELTNADLNTIGLRGKDIDNFRCRLANTREIRLEMLIYSLGISGIKAANAIDLARRITKNKDLTRVDTELLFSYVDPVINQVGKTRKGEAKIVTTTDPAIVAWNEYIRTHKEFLTDICNIINVLPPDPKYKCAGLSFIVADPGKYNRNDIMDLIRLNDGRVISSLSDPYWYFITFLVTDNKNASNAIFKDAVNAGTRIISLTELETKFGIKLPDNDLNYSVTYQPVEYNLDDLF